MLCHNVPVLEFLAAKKFGVVVQVLPRSCPFQGDSGKQALGVANKTFSSFPLRSHWCMLTANGGPVGKTRGPTLALRFPEEEKNMLWTIAVILLVLWALGLVTSFTLGGFIHVLLFAAVVIVVMRVFSGRRMA